MNLKIHIDFILDRILGDGYQVEHVIVFIFVLFIIYKLMKKGRR